MSQHYVGGMKVRTAPGTFRVTDTCPLLISRMTVLDIDPGELNNADPLLFREMQGLCTLCRQKAECMLDLEQHDASLSWKVYCPNAAALASLSLTRIFMLALADLAERGITEVPGQKPAEVIAAQHPPDAPGLGRPGESRDWRQGGRLGSWGHH
jgi:hypothetical protein